MGASNGRSSQLARLETFLISAMVDEELGWYIHTPRYKLVYEMFVDAATAFFNCFVCWCLIQGPLPHMDIKRQSGYV